MNKIVSFIGFLKENGCPEESNVTGRVTIKEARMRRKKMSPAAAVKRIIHNPTIWARNKGNISFSSVSQIMRLLTKLFEKKYLG